MIRTYLQIMRPAQWLKNLMLFFPPLLAGQLLLPGVILKGIVPFGAFCSISSAGYIINDLVDMEKDTHHPRKCMRPLPSGRVDVQHASILAGLLLFTGLLLSIMVEGYFLLFILTYLGITLGYTMVLKDIAVLDLFCIAAGFLIRLQAGGMLYKIPISSWLFLTVLLLALFLSSGKRYGELLVLGDLSSKHRASLDLYPNGFLKAVLWLTAGSTMITYTMYALHKQRLVYSVPLCLFGLLRYMVRVSSGKGGDPTEALLKDKVLLVTGGVWIIMVFWSLYQ